MLRFLDYLPWPVYVAICVLSALIIIKYFVINNKYGVQVKIGALMMTLGITAAAVEKMLEETIFHFEYNIFLKSLPALGVIGSIFFIGGLIKEIDDPIKKKDAKTGYIIACISMTILLFLAYFPELMGLMAKIRKLIN